MRTIDFVDGEFYHLYNRGTDKRDIFLCEDDFERFLESLHLFNDALFTTPRTLHQKVTRLSMSEHFNFERHHYVDVFAYCLIPNHYHLLVRQIQKRGISKLMHKLDMGYSRYLNNRLDRSGTLYEGAFKAIHVDKEQYLEHLPTYIHLNALDLGGFEWRSGMVSDWDAGMEFLSNYRWSSHHAYMNNKQYLPIIKDETVRHLYRDANDYIGHLRGWSSRFIEHHLAKLS